MQHRSPLLAEFAWLAFFFALFVALVYAFNLWVVPHHFNDKVAVMLSAILAGVIMIAVRARWQR